MLLIVVLLGDKRVPQSLHCTALLNPSALPPQRIAYCKSKSDAIAKLDGTFVERKKKKPDEGEIQVVRVWGQQL